MQSIGYLLLGFVALGCLVEKKTAPGFCGPDVKCPTGYECSEQSGPDWRRCVCPAPGCADGGADAGDGAERPADGVVGCSRDLDCPAGLPMCNPSGKCVECTADTQCKAGLKPLCVAEACVPCSAGAAGACALRSPATPVCGPAGSCLECVASKDCSADRTKPICTAANTCTRCTSDAQCAAKPGGPGICMSHQDGRCASDSETIYVNNEAGCASGPPGGTVAMPFCQTQTAIDQVTTTKRVIVVSGTTATGGFLWVPPSGTTAPLTVVGKGGAVLAGGGPVVRVVGAEVFIRNVAIRSGTDVGVAADGGATLRLHESTVDGNTKGGVRTSGSWFEIVNCIITDNSAAFVGPAGFGGAYLGAVSGTGPTTFAFNTVVANKGPGVACESSTQPVHGLLLWNNVLADVGNCTLTLSKSTADGDPKLTLEHRLTAVSSCRNAVSPAPADAPAVDIDGVGRPQEGVLDCGASEFKP